MRSLLLSLLIVVLLTVLISLLAGIPVGAVATDIVGGWALFLARSINTMQINWNGVLTAVVCVALIYVGLQWFLRWFFASVAESNPDTEKRPVVWKARWTAGLIAMLMVMFVAGLAFIGIFHQIAWLASGKQHHLEEHVLGVAPSRLQLVQIRWNTVNYESIYKTLPTYGAPSPNGGAKPKGKHSWLTLCLPFGFTMVEPIDYDVDWDHPKNGLPFRRVVREFLQPEVAPFRNGDGYALSHYAGNVHLLGAEAKIGAVRMGQGSSNVVLAGEAGTAFKPWGGPDQPARSKPRFELPS